MVVFLLKNGSLVNILFIFVEMIDKRTYTRWG